MKTVLVVEDEKLIRHNKSYQFSFPDVPQYVA